MLVHASSRLYFTLLLGVLFLAFFLRFYQLGNIPVGLNQDETSIGYNAYSILKTGKDEHGIILPLYFKSFNDYKLPVYIYLTAVAEQIFGITSFAVRFFSAFLGSLTVVAFYFLVKSILDNKQLALLACFFLAINPWHVFFSRIGFEVNVAVSFVTFGALFFELALKTKKAPVLYVVAALCFIAALYSYNITRIHAPLTLLILIGLHRKKIFSLSRTLLISLLCLFILAEIPFVLTLMSHSGLQYQTNVLISNGESKASMVELRSYMLGLPHIFTVLFFNSGVLLFWQYLKNIIATFSVSFFFITAGSQLGDVGVGNAGMFYPIEFIFILFGLYKVIVHKDKRMLFFILWIIVVVLVVSFSTIVPTGTRSFAMVIPLTVLSAYGCWEMITLARQQRPLLRYCLFIFIIIGVGYGFIFFQTSYYTRFSMLYTTWWRVEDKTLSLYLKDHEALYSHIVFDKKVNFIYTSLMFYQAYPPLLFQKNAQYEKEQLFTNVEKIGKYEIKQIKWSDDLLVPHTLFITEPDNIPQNLSPVETIYYPTRPVVLSVENKIIQYPITEKAFVLFSTDK